MTSPLDPSGPRHTAAGARPREIGRWAAAPGAAAQALLRALAEWGGVVLGACGLLLLWATVLHSLSTEREQALGGAVQDTVNLARAFEETIVRSIKSVDQSLLYIRDSRQRDPEHFDIGAWTRSVQALTDMTLQISIIDRDGFLVGSNLPAGGRVDLSDREHFRIHRERPDDTLFISKPILGRVSHRWSIQLTRKVLASDGSFGGVIVISLDPQYLSRFYDSVDLGRGGLVLLVGTDGIVRAGARERIAGRADGQPDAGTDPTIGRSLLGTPLFSAFASAPSGHMTVSNSSIDALERVTAYRTVRGLPLLVAVGVATRDILRTHRRHQVAYTLVAAAISVMMIVVIGLVTERQRRLTRARRMLRASEADQAQKSRLLETTLEHMSQGIMMVNGEGYVMVCNQHAMDAVGLPHDLMASRPHFEEVVRWQWQHNEFGPDGSDVDEQVRAFVLAGGLSDEAHSYERTRPNGTVLEVRSTPLPGGGLVRTYTDITGSKRNEAILRAARDEADAAANAKSEFLATMSHEIRSPMSGLVGVLELLRETNLDPKQADMAQMVHASAMSLLDVLNDILDLSKIEADGITIVLGPTDVMALANTVAQPHSLQAARKQVMLDVRFEPEVAGFIALDALRVGQILHNLLSNAVKFTSAGTISMTVDRVHDGGRPMLRFTVADSGIGMDADVLARLFNPFTQADGSISRKYGGTGLGLCISKRLAGLHDGRLEVTSSPGVGSTFTLLLPWRPVASVQAGPPAPAAVGSAHALPQARILVADDDPTNRWLSQRQLELLGFDVEVAEHGAMAFRMLSDKQYDLLLTDCHMPGMDGVALTRAVRSAVDLELRSLPIIGLTADVTAAHKGRCVDAGMTELAYKPLSRAMLATLLSRILGSGPGGAPPRPHDGVPKACADGPEQIFDPAQYRDLFGPGDTDGPAWLGEYLESAGKACARLTERLFGSLDGAAIRHDVEAIAHQLAGSSLSVGAVRLGALARRLEHAAITAPLSVLQADHITVCSGLEAAGQTMMAFVDAGAPNGSLAEASMRASAAPLPRGRRLRHRQE